MPLHGWCDDARVASKRRPTDWLERVAEHPTAPDCVAWTTDWFTDVEARPDPEASHVRILCEHALLWAQLGHAGRGIALVRRWRKRGVDEEALSTAEAVFAMLVDPGFAGTRLRALAQDVRSAGLAVIHHVRRAELRPAIELAERCGWFLEHPELADGTAYALWALILLEEFERVDRISSEWIDAHATEWPDGLTMLLRTQATNARYQHRYGREESLTEEACSVARHYKLGMARMFAETALCVARARTGDLDGSRSLIRSWPKPKASDTSPIAGYRNLARLDVALLEGEYGRAEQAARRAVSYCDATKDAVLACHVAFATTLAANAKTMRANLRHLRRLVHRYPVRLYQQRLAILDVLTARGSRPARNVRLRERTRWGSELIPLVRLWTPRMNVLNADLYWDRISGSVHAQGEGPLRLDDHPVLAALAAALVDAPGFSAEVDRVFAAVWGGEYDPLAHENKVHVTAHRLRRWYKRHADTPRDILEIQGGRIGIPKSFEVRIVERVDVEPGRVRAVNLSAGIVDALAGGSLSGPDLAFRLGVSRTALHRALRALLEEGTIARSGRARATRYTLRSN